MSKAHPNAAERFLETAGRYPSRPALETGNLVMSYRQLADEALKIRDLITGRGDDGPFVAVVADKSPACYAAILGILMAGKAYLPLNPRFPAQRNRFMLQKSMAGHLFHSGKMERTEFHRPSRQGNPEQYAYLLFTSGTTGEPKGVPVSHENLSAYLDFMVDHYDFNPEDRFTQNFDLTFDLSVHDLFLCWSAGGCLCVPDDNSSFALAGFIRRKQPTVWFSVPSAAALMDRMRLLKPGAFPSIRHSFFCGEPLLARTAAAWKNATPHGRLTNLYGPTEATIAISGYDLPSEEQDWKQEIGILSIGKIFGHNQFMIREEPGEVYGELCLSGPQVVRGYFENPDADARSFFETGAPPERWYRTGDRVSCSPDGDLFYRGRSDAEVKISGFRVDLGEIEHIISSFQGVRQTVVILHRDSDTQETLAAFIMPENWVQPDVPGLDAHCRESLPWYMVPGKFIFVEDFPLNPNGKIDRNALSEQYL